MKGPITFVLATVGFVLLSCMAANAQTYFEGGNYKVFVENEKVYVVWMTQGWKPQTHTIQIVYDWDEGRHWHYGSLLGIDRGAAWELDVWDWGGGDYSYAFGGMGGSGIITAEPGTVGYGMAVAICKAWKDIHPPKLSPYEIEAAARQDSADARAARYKKELKAAQLLPNCGTYKGGTDLNDLYGRPSKYIGVTLVLKKGVITAILLTMINHSRSDYANLIAYAPIIESKKYPNDPLHIEYSFSDEMKKAELRDPDPKVQVVYPGSSAQYLFHYSNPQSIDEILSGKARLVIQVNGVMFEIDNLRKLPCEDQRIP